MSSEELLNLFQTKLGLSEAKAKDTVKNAGLSKVLQEAISLAEKSGQKYFIIPRNFVYHIATKIKPTNQAPYGISS